jgi:glycosyltransferase involved in cell wall biosynthesis
VENTSMASAYRKADLFISTSGWEGYPYNVQEALALGRPTVAFDIPGCNDLVDNGQNGYVVKSVEEFQERLQALIGGAKLHPDIAAYSRSRNDPAGILKEMAAFFESCAGDRPRKKLPV